MVNEGLSLPFPHYNTLTWALLNQAQSLTSRAPHQLLMHHQSEANNQEYLGLNVWGAALGGQR